NFDINHLTDILSSSTLTFLDFLLHLYALFPKKCKKGIDSRTRKRHIARNCHDLTQITTTVINIVNADIALSRKNSKRVVVRIYIPWWTIDIILPVHIFSTWLLSANINFCKYCFSKKSATSRKIRKFVGL